MKKKTKGVSEDAMTPIPPTMRCPPCPPSDKDGEERLVREIFDNLELYDWTIESNYGNHAAFDRTGTRIVRRSWVGLVASVIRLSYGFDAD